MQRRNVTAWNQGGMEQVVALACIGVEAHHVQGEPGGKAINNIRILFEKFPAAAELLEKAVEPVAGGAVKSITVNLEGGVKGTLKLGSSGKVRLKKTTTTTDEIE